jgi:hypothetical protein
MSAPDFRRTHWIKSSFSEPRANCVELATVDGWTGVRDSTLGDASPILIFTAAELTAFLNATRNGAPW